MSPALRMIAIVAVTLLLSGCANYRQMTVPQRTLTPAEMNFEAVWQASLDVLRGYHFPIDRRDRRAAIITTDKIVGRHWFEFWRRDAVSGYDLAEGTLQTVHRSVRVRITPVAGRDGEFAASVEVMVSRPNRQGLEIIATGEAYGKFLDAAGDDDFRRRKRQRDEQRRERRRLRLEGKLGEMEAGTPDLDETAKGDSAAGANLARRIADEIRQAARKRLAQAPR